MTTTIHATDVSGFSEQELRRHNRAIVEDYLARTGEARLDRYLLFTPDGEGGLWTTDTLEPIMSRGHEQLRKHGIWSLQCFPDWVWYDLDVFETQDPNRFWVECDGKGTINFPGYPTGYYENHFLHAFRFENGRIKQEREFMNPFRQLLALGIGIPEIRREGIPA